MAFLIHTEEGVNIPIGNLIGDTYKHTQSTTNFVPYGGYDPDTNFDPYIVGKFIKKVGDRLHLTNGAYLSCFSYIVYDTYNLLRFFLYSKDDIKTVLMIALMTDFKDNCSYDGNFISLPSDIKVSSIDDALKAIKGLTGNFFFCSGIRRVNKTDTSWDKSLNLQTYGSITTTNEMDTLISALSGASSTPILPGGDSTTGGGTGTFDLTSDSVDFSSLPTLSAVSTGLVTVFRPDVVSLNNLAAFLWSDLFDVATFKKLFANPMDALLGLSIVPCEVPSSSTANVKIGYVDTGVSMSLADTQYVAVDCGSLTPKEYWGSALDYAPYSKFAIYLPYIGTHQISTDEIMGKELHVMYHIDILSGTCTVMVKSGGSVLYEWSGSCGSGIPITNQNFSQFVTTAVQLAGAGVAVAATGGASAPVTAGAVRGMAASAAEYTAANVSSIKPHIEHTGAVSGSAGMLGVQVPYLIWELPNQSLAKDYNHFVGYPSNITSTLGSLSGYTRIENIQLYGIDATDNELTEIENLLIEGVII